MRHIIVILLVFMSSVACGQDIRFKLSGAKSKKWIGINVFTPAKEENETTLTFYSNLTLQEYSLKYKKPSLTQPWRVTAGDYVDDASIVIEIGDRGYNVEFSKTSNGRDFLTLTRITQHEWESPLMKTYYAE